MPASSRIYVTKYNNFVQHSPSCWYSGSVLVLLLLVYWVVRLLMIFLLIYKIECYYIYSEICLVVFPFKISATWDFYYYISMFITIVALLCYNILYFDISSLSSYVLHFIPSFNLSSIYLIFFCSSLPSLKADCHAIHPAALCTDDNFNDYDLISSQVFQWWYSFGWPCYVKYMCIVYKWYKTHAALSQYSPTGFPTIVMQIHSSTFASVLSWIHIS